MRKILIAVLALWSCATFAQGVQPETKTGSIVVGAPTGGNCGTGCVNAQAIQVNGAAVGGGGVSPGTAGQVGVYSSTGSVVSGTSTPNVSGGYDLSGVNGISLPGGDITSLAGGQGAFASFAIPGFANSLAMGLNAGGNITTCTGGSGHGYENIYGWRGLQVDQDCESAAFGVNVFYQKVTGQYDNGFGNDVGANVTGGAGGINGFGHGSCGGGGGGSALTGAQLTCFGDGAGAFLSGTASYDTFCGALAGQGTVTNQNTSTNSWGCGWGALQNLSTGINETACGFAAIEGSASAPLTGNSNTACGAGSGENIQGNSFGNTFYGYESGFACTGGCYQVMAIGNLALSGGSFAGTNDMMFATDPTCAFSASSGISDEIDFCTSSTSVLRITGGGTPSTSVASFPGVVQGATISTGGTTARSWAARGADVINAADFGAVCNGTVDDSAAFNAAINVVRARSAAAAGGFSWFIGKTGHIVGPTGTCVLKEPINATSSALSSVSATISVASPAVITATNAFLAGAPLTFATTGALPAGLAPGTTYYVSAAGLSSSTFQVAATMANAIAGTSSIGTSGSQSGSQTYSSASTSLYGSGFVLDMTGVTFLCETNGLPCVDMTGTGAASVLNMNINGNCSSNTPSFGLTLGRQSTTAGGADQNRITNLVIAGCFTTAPYFNNQSETTVVDHMAVANAQAGAYGAIWDGANHFNFQSNFTGENYPQDNFQSFNENTCIQCIVNVSGIGSTPVWIGGTARHKFSNGYFATFATPATTPEPAVKLWFGVSAGQALLNDFLDLDVHFENDGGASGALNAIIDLMGTQATSVTVRGLRLRDNYTEQSGPIFKVDSSSTIAAVIMTDADWSIGQQAGASPSWFDTPANYTVYGHVFDQSNTWTTPATFVGDVGTGSTAPSYDINTINPKNGTNLLIQALGSTGNTTLIIRPPTGSTGQGNLLFSSAAGVSQWQFGDSSGSWVLYDAVSNRNDLVCYPNTSSNLCQLMTSSGNLQLGNSSGSIAVGGATAGPSNGSITAPTLGTSGYTIAGLPTCNSTAAGQNAYVTNGVTSPTYLGAVSTTGSTVAPVFCTGTGWIYH